MTFRAPMCAVCGHAVADHAWNRSVTNPRHGICLVDGCECREFREAVEDEGPVT